MSDRDIPRTPGKPLYRGGAVPYLARSGGPEPTAQKRKPGPFC